MALVGLHAAAALRHHFILKDDVLRHILPVPSIRNQNALGKGRND
jgi:cytochrome b561